MRRLLTSSLAALAAGSLSAQAPNPTIEVGAASTFVFSWYGKADRTFFLQYSDDLKTWNYFPLIKVGDDEQMTWGFFTDASDLYLRVQYTDSTVVNPLLDDFDGDTIPNWVEVELLNTNPLEADTDGDGLNDNLEDSDSDGILDVDEVLLNAGDFTLADTDGDGWSDSLELEMGTNPFLADTDGDGTNDNLDPLPLIAHETIATDPTPSTGPVITILSPEVTPFP